MKEAGAKYKEGTGKKLDLAIKEWMLLVFKVLSKNCQDLENGSCWGMSRKRRIDCKRNRRNAEKRSGGNLKMSRGGECGGSSKFPG